MTRTVRPGILAAMVLLTGWIVPAIAMGDSAADMQDSKGQLNAKASAGRSVTFTGHGGGASYFGGVWLHFGDGQNEMFCRPGSGCRETTLNHTYAQAGTYEAKLLGAGEGESVTLGTVTVTVSE